jgi:hypothetical protein
MLGADWGVLLCQLNLHGKMFVPSAFRWLELCF